jgi:hypothetical protein
VRIQVLLLIVLLSLFAVTAVAADISGNWTSEAPGRGDGAPPQVTKYAFTVSGTTLTGKITSNRGGQDVVQDITEGKISGEDISFVTVREGQNGTMKTNFKGKVAGSEIKLTREMVMPAGGGAPGGGGGAGGGGGRGAGGGGGGGGRGGPAEITLKRAS